MPRAVLLLAVLAGCATTKPEEKPPEPRSRLPAGCMDLPDSSEKPAPLPNARPEEAQLAYERGVKLQEAGDHAGAIAELEAALAADPTHVASHLAKAKSHVQLDGNLELIRRHVTSAVLLDPERAAAHALYAQYLGSTGDSEGAVAQYQCALALDQTLDVREDLAAHLIAESRFAEAEAQLQRVPSETLRHRTLQATALEGQGRLTEAADQWAAAAAATGRSAVLYRRAADLYERAGATDRADAMRSEADRIDPPPEKRDMRPLVKARKRRKPRRKPKK